MPRPSRHPAAEKANKPLVRRNERHPAGNTGVEYQKFNAITSGRAVDAAMAVLDRVASRNHPVSGSSDGQANEPRVRLGSNNYARPETTCCARSLSQPDGDALSKPSVAHGAFTADRHRDEDVLGPHQSLRDQAGRETISDRLRIQTQIPLKSFPLGGDLPAE